MAGRIIRKSKLFRFISFGGPSLRVTVLILLSYCFSWSLNNLPVAGASAKGERGTRKDAGGEQEKSRRISEKGSFRAAEEGRGTVLGAGGAPEAERGGFAEEETGRGGATAKSDESVGQEQIAAQVVIRSWLKMKLLMVVFVPYVHWAFFFSSLRLDYGEIH